MIRLRPFLPMLPLALAWGLALVLPYDPVTDVWPALGGALPSPTAPLGKDPLGRDVLLRLIVATKSFVGPALLGCAFALLLGGPLGVAAGAWGGATGRRLLAPLQPVAALPRFVLILLAAAILGDDAWLLGLAAGLTYAPTLADACRAEVEALRATGWVLAARGHGLGWLGLLGRDLLLGACGRVLQVQLLRLFAFFLGVETSLSFIGGFGVEEPAASWGNMLAFGFGRSGGNPWCWLAPALATWATLAALAAAADRVTEVSAD